MQFVEIAKAISKDAKVLIMDEPTATLANSDVQILFQTIRKLKAMRSDHYLRISSDGRNI